MTPKRDEFEEKLEDEAYKYQNGCHHSGIDAQYCECNMKDAESYMVGARWAREQTIKEVLEALRSDEAADALFMWVGHASPSSAADWLEQRFKGEK